MAEWCWDTGHCARITQPTLHLLPSHILPPPPPLSVSQNRLCGHQPLQYSGLQSRLARRQTSSSQSLLHGSSMLRRLVSLSPLHLRPFSVFLSFFLFPPSFKSSACSCLSLLFVMKCTLSCFTEHASSYLLSCSAFYGACLWQPLPLQHAVLCETRITKSTQVRP